MLWDEFAQFSSDICIRIESELEESRQRCLQGVDESEKTAAQQHKRCADAAQASRHQAEEYKVHRNRMGIDVLQQAAQEALADSPSMPEEDYEEEERYEEEEEEEEAFREEGKGWRGGQRRRSRSQRPPGGGRPTPPDWAPWQEMSWEEYDWRTGSKGKGGKGGKGRGKSAKGKRKGKGEGKRDKKSKNTKSGFGWDEDFPGAWQQRRGKGNKWRQPEVLLQVVRKEHRLPIHRCRGDTSPMLLQ